MKFLSLKDLGTLQTILKGLGEVVLKIEYRCVCIHISMCVHVSTPET